MLGIIILIALIKLLYATNSALLCAGIVGGFSLMEGFFYDQSIIARLAWPVWDFGYAYLFFYLLLEFEEWSKKWWATVIGFLILPTLLAFVF